jgi:hypothetical protein
MIDQITYPVDATVEQDGGVSLRRSKPVTGSPQAMTTLHDFTRVAPKRRGKTLVERISEAYKNKLEPEERELLDRAAEQAGRRLSGQE